MGLQKGETIIMCPYADLINHNPFANTYIVAERCVRRRARCDLRWPRRRSLHSLSPLPCPRFPPPAARPFKPFNPIRGDEVITIYADKDYKKMEQVYISYGPKSNSDLLLLYGFCLDRNPFNSVEIRVNLLEGDPLYEEKRVFLAKAERRESEPFPLYADR